NILAKLSTIARDYNQIQEEIILNKCLDVRSDALLKQFEEKQLTALTSEPIKRQVINDIMELLEDAVAKKLPRNYLAFQELILSKKTQIFDILLLRLQQASGIIGKPDPEIVVTQMTKYD